MSGRAKILFMIQLDRCCLALFEGKLSEGGIAFSARDANQQIR